jgi:hypothetical protein
VQRYLPRIGALAADFAPRGVVTMVVNVGAGDLLVDAAGQASDAAPAAVFARDFDLALARAAGVDRTAAAVVLDGAGRIAYRGRVDDQFGYAGSKGKPGRDDLRMALDDVLAGSTVAVPETAVSGCLITKPAPAATGAAERRSAVPAARRDAGQKARRDDRGSHEPRTHAAVVRERRVRFVRQPPRVDGARARYDRELGGRRYAER